MPSSILRQFTKSVTLKKVRPQQKGSVAFASTTFDIKNNAMPRPPDGKAPLKGSCFYQRSTERDFVVTKD
jgi:hypothetical protein